MTTGAALPMTTSIVILMWNSEAFIGPCLRSLCATGHGACEIVVVDNASRDGSVAAARAAARELGLRATLLALDTNLGCAGGNNAGWRAAQGEAIVFLNPDTEVTAGFAEALVAPIAQDAHVGVTGAKIYYPGTRTLQHAGAFMHPNAMSGHYGAGEEDAGQHDVARECAYVTGAGFAVRRSVLESLRGFDEDYFPAYFEECDLCARVWRAGMTVRYEPRAMMYHHESVSLVANSPSFRRLYQRMRVVYLAKNLRVRGWIRAARFEARWMRNEPAARGQRREQFRAYREGLLHLAKCKWQRLRGNWPLVATAQREVIGDESQ